MNWQKTLARILRGHADGNIRFDDVCQVLIRLGFVERIRGSHSIYKHDEVEEIITLQPRGSLAKAYQVRQVRDLIVRYKLAGEDDNE